MNGILHNCSHANGSGIGLNQIRMCSSCPFYLDRIVHIVKPEKLLYMAIDGVTARANRINNNTQGIPDWRKTAQLHWKQWHGEKLYNGMCSNSNAVTQLCDKVIKV